MSKRWLVLGGSGLLGNFLHYYLANLNISVKSTYSSNRVVGRDFFQVNLASLKAFDISLRENDFCPDVIVNTVALTDVDKCESDKGLADFLNHEVVKVLTDWISHQNKKVKLIQLSTDQVQKGDGYPFSEGDREDPVNYYGKSKLQGERVALGLEESLVCRTNFFGKGLEWRSSITDWILNSLKEGQPITGFEDVEFNPLHMKHLCEYLLRLVELDARGIFHVGSHDNVNKYEFIRMVAQHYNFDPSTIIQGVSTGQKLRVARPMSLTMSVEKLEGFLCEKAKNVSDGISLLT